MNLVQHRRRELNSYTGKTCPWSASAAKGATGRPRKVYTPTFAQRSPGINGFLRFVDSVAHVAAVQVYERLQKRTGVILVSKMLPIQIVFYTSLKELAYTPRG